MHAGNIMKSIESILVALLLLSTVGLAQQRFEVHSRGMIRQSVFNTGDLGRPLDNGSTRAQQTMPSFEWPSNGGNPIYINGYPYQGYYNSFGGGFWIAADTSQFDVGAALTPRVYAACGGFSDNAGHNQTGDAIPISVDRIENYPVLANGSLNPAYNPDEAEEIIISKWDTPLGVTVTRTSRAWSYPDYDDFIIYDYELRNTGSHALTGRLDTLRAMMVAVDYSLGPSMIGDMLLNTNNWLEASMRGDKAGALSFNYARFNWTRYLVYNQSINGIPFAAGADSILTAPGAIGIMPLYYDYDHLATKSEVYVAPANNTPASDSLILWDTTNALRPVLKQPYNISLDNGNLNIDKFIKYLNIEQTRNNVPCRTSTDSLTFGPYWIGRARMNWTNTLRNPTGKVYGFGPYTFKPNDVMHLVFAEVAGFGGGTAGDSIYSDLGGGWGTGDHAPTPEVGTGVHPVPSWWYTRTYPYLNPRPQYTEEGSTYMQSHSLPDYVNSKTVISIRDVADRAIQMWKGDQVIKYDDTTLFSATGHDLSKQFDPSETPGMPTTGIGRGMSEIPIPLPAPAIFVDNTQAASNKVIWGDQVEAFDAFLGSISASTRARLQSGFSHYLVMRANNPSGPWTILDSVGRRDPRYFKSVSTLAHTGSLTLGDSAYALVDQTSDINQSYFYCVVSVDSLGGESGKTNIALHNTQAPAVAKISHVYAAPNPFVVLSHGTGVSASGDINNQIGFFGLPKRATIRIYSYSGQLVQTIDHESVGPNTPDGSYSTEWYQISRKEQWVASGVYYFVVEDKDTGDRAWNKFVIIH
jgi:hypothetical protein